jgi:hypothetical protein
VGPSDVAGVVTAQFRKYGGCGYQQFFAIVGPITAGPSAPIYIASPDNNGSGGVNLIDFGGFAQGYLTGDPCHDYNCDGIVDLIDFGNFALHYLHDCDHPNP